MPKKADANTAGAFYVDPVDAEPSAAAAKADKKPEKDDRGDWKCGCKCPCLCRIPDRQYRAGRRTCGMCEDGIHSSGYLRKRRPLDDQPLTGGPPLLGSRR